ncbi:hypothetical protein K7I13_15285 [Brucepastera parasyntrophica]|uniref:hypothetical protein n=1 Tax=Brucepastera parasyntrophica TaxID=2880008 RepID=UPI00210DB38C|nr:hypothetical protein [Brucepastera parasyntrophica]ULQ59786.1 hypothetical protein K7I13_15285 [Brucepastera parasyntrophica]
MLQEDETGAVVIFLPGQSDSVIIRNGSNGNLSPSWMVRLVIDTLDTSGIVWDLEERQTELYKLGWVSDNRLMNAYSRANIPAIMLETDMDIQQILAELVYSFPENIPSETDSHYLISKVDNHVLFISETTMVVLMILAVALILFFLFGFSFIIGKKQTHRIQDLFRISWMMLVYTGITWLALFLAQHFIVFLFSARFGNPDSWELMPRLALAGKISISILIVSLLAIFNRFFRFPEDNFVYGYIASIACLLNIFIFSSVEFSLSLRFLFVYLLSSLFYHLKHPVIQVFGIICMFIPFMPFFRVMFEGNPVIFDSLFKSNGGENLFAAFFILPFEFLITRFLLTIGNFGKNLRLQFPVITVTSLVLSVVSVAAILFSPAWSAAKPLTVEVRQLINDEGSTITTKSLAELKNISVSSDDIPDLLPEPASFLDLNISSRPFIDRQIISFSIIPKIPVQKIEVIISSGNENFISVYTATEVFEMVNAGLQSRFVSGENPSIPYSFSFSSSRDSRLSATVRLWTRSNPYAVTIISDTIETDFLLEIVHTITIPSSSG